MHSTTKVCLIVCVCINVAAAQFFSFGDHNSLSGNFGGPSAFDGVQSAADSLRDPRQNRGPVVFPPSPSDAPVETSGVIVGASGYGFVPPQQSQSLYRPSQFSNFPFRRYF